MGNNLNGNGVVGNVNFNLTATEIKVLGLLATGLSNPSIAANLNVSNSTVRYTLSNIYGKLGIKSRAAAIAYYTANYFIVTPIAANTPSPSPSPSPSVPVAATTPSNGYSVAAIRLAAAKLSKLGLYPSKTVNAITTDIIAALGGTL